MSLGALLARGVGLGLLGLAGWLLLQGQPALVVAIVAGMGVVFFVGAGLSR